VVNSLFLDQRAARLGKWRPCAQARKLGPSGILLDQLLSRDGLPFDEAVGVLRSKYGVSTPLKDLEAMREHLPARSGRSFVDDSEIDTLSAARGTSSAEDDAIRAIDMSSEAERVDRALASALEELSAEDQLILKMRFRDDLQIAQIARLLRLEQKPLYRRIEHVMGVLRRQLVARGVVAERVRELIEYSPGALAPVIENKSVENRVTGPSIP
jgi:RNA polymerase sigma factor for flagellar operon FliA